MFRQSPDHCNPLLKDGQLLSQVPWSAKEAQLHSVHFAAPFVAFHSDSSRWVPQLAKHSHNNPVGSQGKPQLSWNMKSTYRYIQYIKIYIYLMRRWRIDHVTSPWNGTDHSSNCSKCSEVSRSPMELKSESCRLSRGLRRPSTAKKGWFAKKKYILQQRCGWKPWLVPEKYPKIIIWIIGVCPRNYRGCLQSHWIGFRKDWCTPNRGTLAIHVASNQVWESKDSSFSVGVGSSFRYSFSKIPRLIIAIISQFPQQRCNFLGSHPFRGFTALGTVDFADFPQKKHHKKKQMIRWMVAKSWSSW